MKWSKARPVPKVERTAIAGSVVVVVTWIVESIWTVEIPSVVASALVVIVGAVVGWFAPRA